MNELIHECTEQWTITIQCSSNGLQQRRDLVPNTLRVKLLAATQTKDEVEGALLLDIIIRKSAAVLELLASEDETLLVRRNTLLVLDLGLDVVDSIAGLDLEGD